MTARCCLSILPENIRKPKGFLMFSGGIDKQHLAVFSLRLNKIDKKKIDWIKYSRMGQVKFVEDSL